MKLHQLRDFVAVSHAGGIRAAARELGLTQPSLTKSIRQLETSLGVPLFERTGRGLHRTEFGDALFVRASAILADLQRATDEIRQLRGIWQGRVTVSMSGTSLLNLLPGALEVFRRRHPDVRVRIIERPLDQALEELRGGVLDFAVLPEPPATIRDEFRFDPLLTDRYAVVGRAAHPLSSATSIVELLDTEWVVTRQGGASAAEFERYFAALRLTAPSVSIQCETVLGVLSLLAHTDLLALLPSRWLHTRITRNVSAEIHVAEHVQTTPIGIIQRRSAPLSPAAEAFAAALVVESREVERASPVTTPPRRTPRRASSPPRAGRR